MLSKLQLLDKEVIPTRRVSLGTVINQMTKGHDVCLYFSKYGNISAMYIHRVKNLKYLGIVFKHSASVTALLSKGKHNINGVIYEPKMIYGDFPKQFVDLMSDLYGKTSSNDQENTNNAYSAPANDDLSSNILNTLNDHCLMEIFERASVRDLCAIANTCTRFNTNVKKVFAARFTNIDVVCLRDDNSPNQPIPIVLIASLFRNFGMYLKTVTINMNDIGKAYNNRVLSLITKYCTAENCALHGLKISNFKFALNSMNEFRSLFSRVTHLGISEMNDRSMKRLLTMSKNVTHLQLEAISFGRTHKKAFNQLEDVQLICVSDLTDEKLTELISRNQQIKRLVICDPFDQLSPDAYKSIGNLPLLEHLEIEPAISMSEKQSEQNILALAQLKHLKVLRLNCVNTPINELLNSLVEEKCSIQDLSLNGLILDTKNSKSISKMTGIRTLRLLGTSGSDRDHFMQMVKKMPYLQHLVFGGSSYQLSMKNVTELIEATTDLSKLCLIKQMDMVVDLDDYNKMLGLVKQRGNSFGLNIKMLGMKLNLVVPDDVVEQNHKWLNLEIKNFDINPDSKHSEDEPDEESDEDDHDDININLIQMIVMYHMFVNRIHLNDDVD